MTQVPITTPGTMAGILQAIKDIKGVLRGRLTFGDNISAETGITVTTSGVVGTDIPVDHSLGRIPTGFIAVGLDAPVIIYQSSTPWTTTQIFLKSDTSPATFNLTIF
jgi:hypothetical protein